MKLLDTFKKMSRLESLLALLFALFIVLPVDVPLFLANMIDSTLGMVIIFILAVYMFMNVTPVLAVLFVLVSYELLRRSCKASGIGF